MNKEKKKIVKMAAVISAVTVSGGSLAGCGTPVSGDIYTYKYQNSDQQYVLGAQNGSTNIKGVTGKICISSKNRAYINDLVTGGTLYHSAGGTYSINNNEFTLTLDKSLNISNSATILSRIDADKTHIYVPIDICLNETRTFTKTK